MSFRITGLPKTSPGSPAARSSSPAPTAASASTAAQALGRRRARGSCSPSGTPTRARPPRTASSPRCRPSDLRVEHVDLGDLESVRTFTDDEVGPRTSRHPDQQRRRDAVAATAHRRRPQMQMGVNHLGHFALTACCCRRSPTMWSSVSSIAHRGRPGLARPHPELISSANTSADGRLRAIEAGVPAVHSPNSTGGCVSAPGSECSRGRSPTRAGPRRNSWHATDKPGWGVRFSRRATQILGSSPADGSMAAQVTALRGDPCHCGRGVHRSAISFMLPAVRLILSGDPQRSPRPGRASASGPTPVS